MEIYIYLGLGATIVLLIAFLALTFPYTFGGLRIMLGKMKYKSNTGLVFLRSKSGNFPMPIPCDLSAQEFKVKIGKAENTYPLHRSHFERSGLFFGMPFVFYDVEDAKNTIGLYYEDCNENGEPTGKITQIKPAISLPPSIIKALIGEQALTQALKKLFSDNQILLYIVIGNILVSAISVYFAYELQSTTIPLLLSKLDTIIGLVGTV